MESDLVACISRIPMSTFIIAWAKWLLCCPTFRFGIGNDAPEIATLVLLGVKQLLSLEDIKHKVLVFDVCIIYLFETLER